MDCPFLTKQETSAYPVLGWIFCWMRTVAIKGYSLQHDVLGIPDPLGYFTSPESHPVLLLLQSVFLFALLPQIIAMWVWDLFTGQIWDAKERRQSFRVTLFCVIAACLWALELRIAFHMLNDRKD